MFAALGDPVRLALLDRLNDGRARSIRDLTAGTGLTRQGVTKHLKVLERSGLVEAARVGRERRYTCQPRVLNEARIYLEQVAAEWDQALHRLRSFVEDQE